MYKKVAVWFVLSLVIAFVGIYFSDFFGDIFNGLPSGTGNILGMGAYLCIVVITCTGIIVSKLDEKGNREDDKKDN